MKHAEGRWLLYAAIALSAFWPRFDDLTELPADPLGPEYLREARNTLALFRDNPLQRLFDRFVVQQWRFHNWRKVPGSGEGSTSIPSMMDVRVDATALGPWGIPLTRVTIGCGGACIQRP